MINNVTLVGRLTKDPELKYTQAGVAVANFTLAVNRTFNNAQGEKEADFIMCQVWRKPAENVANYLKKGSLAGVTGSIRTRHYEGNDGKRVYVTEVHCDSVQFLDPAGSRGGQGDQGLQAAADQVANHNQQQGQQGYGNNNQGNYQPNNQGQYRSGNQGNSQPNNQQGYGSNNQGGYGQQQGQQNWGGNDPFSSNGQPIEIKDDDLPF